MNCAIAFTANEGNSMPPPDLNLSRFGHVADAARAWRSPPRPLPDRSARAAPGDATRILIAAAFALPEAAAELWPTGPEPETPVEVAQGRALLEAARQAPTIAARWGAPTFAGQARRAGIDPDLFVPASPPEEDDHAA